LSLLPKIILTWVFARIAHLCPKERWSSPAPLPETGQSAQRRRKEQSAGFPSRRLQQRCACCLRKPLPRLSKRIWQRQLRLTWKGNWMNRSLRTNCRKPPTRTLRPCRRLCHAEPAPAL